MLIALIYFAAWRRGREPSSAKLPLPMYAIRMSLGVVFLFLGVVGSLLPILQGWIFFLLAALLFFPNSGFAVKALHKAEPRIPRVVAFLRRLGIGEEPARDGSRKAE
ncbi:MAG: hypothetical protein WA208_19070 [Thermoanaerobaculia bacterium]